MDEGGLYGQLFRQLRIKSATSGTLAPASHMKTAEKSTQS